MVSWTERLREAEKERLVRTMREILLFLSEPKPLHEFATFLWRIRIHEDDRELLRREGFFRWYEDAGRVYYTLGEGALLLYATALLKLLPRRSRDIEQLLEPLPPEWRERLRLQVVPA